VTSLVGCFTEADSLGVPADDESESNEESDDDSFEPSVVPADSDKAIISKLEAHDSLLKDDVLQIIEAGTDLLDFDPHSSKGVFPH